MRWPRRARSPVMVGHDWSSPDALAAVQGLVKSALYPPVSGSAKPQKGQDPEAVRHDDQLNLPPDWEWPLK